jgi:HEAT repeat protein
LRDNPCVRPWSPLLLVLVAGVRAGEETLPADLIGSAEPAKREQAAGLLGKQGDTAAAKQLVGLLDDRDWGVRMAALRALGPIAFGPGREAIREQALEGETRGLRALAARMLAAHDAEDAAAAIARRLKGFKKEDRLPSLEALGIIGTAAGIAALEGQMRSPEPSHRAAAARALGRLGAGMDALIRGLQDREEEVQILSLCALAGLDAGPAREEALDYLAKPGCREDDYLPRRVGQRAAAANLDAITAAVNARLEKAADPGPFLRVAWYGRLAGCAAAARAHFRARDPVDRAFAFACAGLGREPLPWDDVRRALDQRDGRLQHAAATALLAAAGDGFAEPLGHLLQHKEGEVVLVGVRFALAKRHKESLPLLAAVAAGETKAAKDWHARVAACVALGRIGGGEAHGTILPWTRAREWWLRAAAFEGLLHTYRREVVPAYIAAFDDRHPVVRLTVRKNLRFMTRKHFPRRSMYEDYWREFGDKVDFGDPEEKIKELDRSGYDTRRYIQEILKGTDIVVVLGKWDKVELVLQDLEVSHNAVRAQDLKEQGVTAKQVVLVNCEGSVDSEVAEYLQWCVVAGGSMATTDWSLMNALTRTFPHVIGGYVKQSTGNDVVVVEPAVPGHPTLAGVFREDVAHKWWLEIQAFPLSVEDPVRATVLVDSLEMLLRYGSSAMMAEFPAGLGKVLHSTSHFYLQKEGFASESDPLKRKVFAADYLGLSMEEIRDLDAKGVFRNVNDTTPISRSYSMFHVLVNFIEEKRQADRNR